MEQRQGEAQAIEEKYKESSGVLSWLNGRFELNTLVVQLAPR